jgi:type IV pilus assembly protein PilP
VGPEKPADPRMLQVLRFVYIFLIAATLLFSLSLLACKKESPAPQPSRPIPRAAGPAGAPPSPSPVAQPAEQATPVPTAAYAYDPGGRRDPFTPLATLQEREEKKKGLKSLQVSDLRLSGIVWDKKEYVALVEAPDRLGYVLKVNDLIGNTARVARISPESVLFEVKESPYLPKSKIKEVELKFKKEE